MDDLVGQHVVRLQLPAPGVTELRPVGALGDLASRLVACRRYERLVAWREQVAEEKRAAYAHETYWARPVPGFGDPAARVVIVGLAPAAHGANRTGRMFTGDRSGEWLFRALHRTGFANRPEAVAVNDGLRLDDVWITSAVKCAPPANKPTPDERETCAGWLAAELSLLPNACVFLCLGQFGYHALWRHLAARGRRLPHPRPKFAHGLEVAVEDIVVLASYHPSQHNTFTGKLTEEMLDSVLIAVRQAAIRAGLGE